MFQENFSHEHWKKRLFGSYYVKGLFKTFGWIGELVLSQMPLRTMALMTNMSMVSAAIRETSGGVQTPKTDLNGQTVVVMCENGEGKKKITLQYWSWICIVIEKQRM